MTEKVFTIAGRKVVRRCSAEKWRNSCKLPLAQNGTTGKSPKRWLGAGMVSIEPDK